MMNETNQDIMDAATEAIQKITRETSVRNWRGIPTTAVTVLAFTSAPLMLSILWQYTDNVGGRIFFMIMLVFTVVLMTGLFTSLKRLFELNADLALIGSDLKTDIDLIWLRTGRPIIMRVVRKGAHPFGGV